MDAELRMGEMVEERKVSEFDAQVDRIIRGLGISWEGERNWFSKGPSGSWTVMYTQAQFMELFDVLWVVCFITIAFIMVNAATSGDLKTAVYMIIYLLMLFLYEVYFLTERLDAKKLFSSAVMDWGDKNRTTHYLKVGVVVFLAYVALSVAIYAVGGFQSVLPPILPMAVTGVVLSIFVSAVAIPIAEECGFRGVLTAYMTESFGIVPGILLSGLVSAAFHWQVFNATPQFIILAGLFGMMNGYVILKERALAPVCVSHILVNGLVVVLTII